MLLRNHYYCESLAEQPKALSENIRENRTCDSHIRKINYIAAKVITNI